MNYKFRHTALLAALPLLLAACQTDDEPMPQTGKQANTLRFTVDAAIALTKSLPEKPQTEAGAVQHVNAARLYIFKHGEEGQTTLAACEEITDFNGLTTTDGGGQPVTGLDGLTTVTKEYELQTKLDPTATYTFLGVGYEKQDQTTNEYGDAYQEETDGSNTALTVSESPVTLSTLVTTLKTGRGKEDIRHNEYFTGALTLTTDGNGLIQSGTVEMRRRVAGLSAYLQLKNFPEDKTIGGVAIMLWDKQNQAVPTLEKTWQLPDFTDYTDKPLDTPDAAPQAKSVCLLWMTQSNTATQAYDAAGSYYTCQGSAYVLPKPAPTIDSDKNYTLAVVVYNAENEIICTKRAALSEEGNLIFDTSLGTGIIDDGSFYRYPIVANRFYRFGDTASGTTTSPSTWCTTRRTPSRSLSKPSGKANPIWAWTTTPGTHKNSGVKKLRSYHSASLR